MSLYKENIKRVFFEKDSILLETIDGKIGAMKLHWFPLFNGASKKQLSNYKLSYSGIHWEDLDEDLSYESFFYPKSKYFTNKPIADILSHYKSLVNLSGLAKITGISSAQLGHYSTGYRSPRPAQRKKIINGLHKIGKEIQELV